MVYVFFVTPRIVPGWLADFAISESNEVKQIFLTRQLATRVLGDINSVWFK